MGTYHIQVPIVKKSGTLTSWNPVGLFRLVMGHLYLLPPMEAEIESRRYFKIVQDSTVKTHLIRYWSIYY